MSVRTAHPRSMLVPLGPISQAPVFYFHGMFHGDGFAAWGISRLLGPELSLIVVHPHGFDGGPVPPTIAAMAEMCVVHIRRQQPYGPYRLVGFCVGGMVAFEVARRLVASGEIVEDVVVISSWIHESVLHELRIAYAHFKALAGSDKLYALRSKINRRFGNKVDLLGNRSDAELDEAYLRAVRAYRPGAFSGRLTLISGLQNKDLPRNYAEAWRRAVPNLQHRTVEGAHYCAEQNPQGVSAVLRSIFYHVAISQPAEVA